jgi:DNA processing protein
MPRSRLIARKRCDCLPLRSTRSLAGAGPRPGMARSDDGGIAGLVDRGPAIISGAAYGNRWDGPPRCSCEPRSDRSIPAGGVDRFYPSGHALLARTSQSAQCLQPPCGPRTRAATLQRNRLTAAASQRPPSCSRRVGAPAVSRPGTRVTSGDHQSRARSPGGIGGLPPTHPGVCGHLVITSAAEMAELVHVFEVADRSGPGPSRHAIAGPGGPDAPAGASTDALSPGPAQCRRSRGAIRYARLGGGAGRSLREPSDRRRRGAIATADGCAARIVATALRPSEVAAPGGYSGPNSTVRTRRPLT